MTYSLFGLLRNALSHHQKWKPAWRKASPQASYDYLIVGGGGHGLATAYYLAKRYGGRRIAVLEKGWVGGGNTARNTTIIRSNYLMPASAALYDHSVSLWEGPVDRHQLQCHVLPAGAAAPRPHGQRPARSRSPRRLQPGARHRRRAADAGTGEGMGYPSSTCTAATRSWARCCNGAAA